jgi:hypothetical protein
VGAAVLGSAFTIGLSAEAASQTRVYRCTNHAGETEFRQTACSLTAREEELTIEDRRTGWVPPRPAAEPAPSRGRQGPRHSGPPKQQASESKQDERCWKKRRQLEEVSWRLRRGYKPGAGDTLRRRRDNYEAYIDRFCEGLGR